MKTDEEYVEEYRPLVASIAHKLRARYDLRVDLDDLLAYGFAGLLEAKQRFDPSRGVQFNTFAYYRIRGSMLDGVRRTGYHSRRAHQQMKAAEAALAIGEATGNARAADPGARGDTQKTAEQLRDTLAKLTASYVIASVGQAEDDTEHETPEDRLIEGELAGRLREAITVLPERERALVEGFYFQGRRFDHVAAELGISKSWASRLHSKALKLLREAIEGDD